MARRFLWTAIVVTLTAVVVWAAGPVIAGFWYAAMIAR